MISKSDLLQFHNRVFPILKFPKLFSFIFRCISNMTLNQNWMHQTAIKFTECCCVVHRYCRY